MSPKAIASFVALFELYVNWTGSKESGREEQM